MLYGIRAPLYAEAGEGVGAGAGSPGAFSADQLAALDARMDDRLNNALGGFAKNFKKDITKMFSEALTSAMPDLTQKIAEELIPSDEEIAQFEQEEADRMAQEEDGQRGDPETNARLLELQRTNDGLTKRLQDIERKSQESEAKALQAQQEAAVSAALNPYPFANDDYRDLTYQYFMSRVKRDSQGNFIVPSGEGDLPLKDALEQRMGNMSGMLAAKPVSGAGATSFPGSSRDSGPSLEAIKPGMSKETRDSTAAAIAQFYNTGNVGTP